MEIQLYKYCNPYAEESNTKSFIVKNEFITITQNKEKGIGWTFWDCVIF
jgi:hypothetical protein